MIYLDNASTTHIKPKSVIRNVNLALTKYSVNAGRGGYKLSIDAGNIVLDTRIKLAQMFNVPTPTNVIFTASCTAAINAAIKGTIKPKGHIIATCFEHNSVLRTLDYVKCNYDIDYTIVQPNSDGEITSDEIEKAITDKTYMVITIHSSNVTGITQDIAAIGTMCKKHGLIYMVDCAQSAGHIKIDMQNENINLVTLAGHKGLYAPQGVGVLLINNVTVLPTTTGGTGTFSSSTVQPTDLPEGLESGTLALPNIMGLKAGIEYIGNNFDKISQIINKLTAKTIQKLQAIPNVVVYSKYNDVGVVSFNIVGISSSEVATALFERYGICVRSGLQCAPLIHKYHKTLQQGMVRVSYSAFNTLGEVDRLIEAVRQIAKS